MMHGPINIRFIKNTIVSVTMFNILLSVQSQFVVIFTLKSFIYDLRNIKGFTELQTDIF